MKIKWKVRYPALKISGAPHSYGVIEFEDEMEAVKYIQSFLRHDKGFVTLYKVTVEEIDFSQYKKIK